MKREFIGIEIGGSKLQIVAGGGDGSISQRHRFVVDADGGGEAIRGCILRNLPSIAVRTEPAAIGVGFGGPVDRRTGHVGCSHQVEGWNNYPLGPWLAEKTGLPVHVENDSNCAALAEATCGAGRGSNPVFYFNMGSGVGGGLVVDGRIYHGAVPGEVEFGHLRLDRDGTIVEQRCSGWAVDARIRAVKQSHPESVLCRLTAGMSRGEAMHLAEALKQDDASAKQILAEVASDTAFALSHAVHLFHPSVIVMGGGLSLVGGPLRHAVAEALKPWVMKAFHPVPELRTAAMGEDAVPVGALILAAAHAAGR